MSASAELRALLVDVAAGKVTVDLATGAIARWMVLATGAIKEVPVEALMRESAGYAREESAEIAESYANEIHDLADHVESGTEIARRIRARGDTLNQRVAPAPRADQEEKT